MSKMDYFCRGMAIIAATCTVQGCDSPVEITVTSTEVAPATIATNDDLLALLRTRNVDAIVDGLNSIKGMRFQGQFLPTVDALWNRDIAAYPDVAWDVIDLSVVRLQVADILVQAHRNGDPSSHLEAIHAYAVEQAGGGNSDAVRSSISLISMFNEPSDVALLQRLGQQERHLRAVMAALNSMCIPEADLAAERILASCTTGYCGELGDERIEMLAFKERTSWCSGSDTLLQ